MIKKLSVYLIFSAVLFSTTLPSYGSGGKAVPVKRVSELLKLGSTEVEIFDILPDNITVIEATDLSVSVLCSYDYIKKILQPGITTAGNSTILYPALAKMYELTGTSNAWPKIASVRLLFYRANDTESSYRLFLIRSVMDVEVSDFNTTFEKYTEAGISNRHGLKPEIVSTTYTNNILTTPAQAKLAIWADDSIFEALTIMDNGSFIFPEFIYYSKKELNSYFTAVTAYKKPSQANQASQAVVVFAKDSKPAEDKSEAKKQPASSTPKKKPGSFKR
ncbi:MAG: hypothetical protein LBK47_06445 [Prevotellaceae bacterium]|jgi:hypothetical protein|nr:hypothetical protein [Prevotellaceae bacterium]